MLLAAQPPYWFKPARFWGWFAAYYPVSWQGWLVTLVLLGLVTYVFKQIDANSHSASSTLIGFALPFVFIAILFDLACRLKGEYPWWWRKR